MARKRRIEAIRQLILTVYRELVRTNAFEIAASMGFYFLFSLMPLLIFATALFGFLPIPNLFGQLHQIIATFVPASSLVAGVLTQRRGGLLSLGLLAYLYSVTSAFAATIRALNVAYDVTGGRSWWRERLRALLLSITSGLLSFLSLLLLLAGPLFLHLLARTTPVSHALAEFWSAMRIVILFVTLVLGVQLLYYLGPNRKQRFLPTLYGALIAVVIWLLGSYGLQYYLSHFAHYNRTYGSLGLAMSLMLWFYWIGLGILIGAEWNAEWAKLRARYHEPSPGKGKDSRQSEGSWTESSSKLPAA